MEKSFIKISVKQFIDILQRFIKPILFSYKLLQKNNIIIIILFIQYFNYFFVINLLFLGITYIGILEKEVEPWL